MVTSLSFLSQKIITELSSTPSLSQVRGLPTLFFISSDPNKDAIRTEGLIPIQMMRDIIDNEM